MRNPVRPGSRRAFTAGQIRAAYANATLLAVWLDQAEWLTRNPSFGNLTPPDRRERIASGYEGLIRDFLKAKAAFDCEDLYRLAERLYPLGQRLIVAGRPYACMIEGLATEVERSLRHAIPVDAMPPRDWRYREHLSDQSREDWLRQWPEVQEESWHCLMTELRTIVTPELRCDLGREGRKLESLLTRADSTASLESPASMSFGDKKDDAADFQPAGEFPKSMRARLREATADGRKTKAVRFVKRGGVKYYSRTDAKQFWPQEFKADERRSAQESATQRRSAQGGR